MTPRHETPSPETPGRCPCGTGLPYDECCGRLHGGEAHAATAEQLMRSRYSAFVLGDTGWLLATWHPDTRPASVQLDPRVRWTGLEVLATTGGTLFADTGTVEFRAHRVRDGVPGSQHEDSVFLREGGLWLYRHGTALA